MQTEILAALLESLYKAMDGARLIRWDPWAGLFVWRPSDGVVQPVQIYDLTGRMTGVLDVRPTYTGSASVETEVNEAITAHIMEGATPSSSATEWFLEDGEWFDHDGMAWNVSAAKLFIKEHPRDVVDVPVSRFAFDIPDVDIGDAQREVDLSVPVILLRLEKDDATVDTILIDGWHRIKKAYDDAIAVVPGVFLSRKEEILCRMSDNLSARARSALAEIAGSLPPGPVSGLHNIAPLQSRISGEDVEELVRGRFLTPVPHCITPDGCVEEVDVDPSGVAYFEGERVDPSSLVFLYSLDLYPPSDAVSDDCPEGFT